jgi:4-hydroxybenzoate polyprenyltransferase
MSLRLLPLPYRWIERIIVLREKQEYAFATVLAFAVFVGLVRVLLELMVCSPGIYASFAGYLSNVTFYLMNAFLYATAIRFIIRVDWRKSMNVVLIGVFVGIFPPLIDTLVLGTHNFRYAYNFTWLDGWRWLIYNPEAHISPGEAFTLWFTILLLPLYVWVKTRSPWRALTGLVAGYAVVFFYMTVVASAAAALLKMAFVPMLRATEVPLIDSLERAWRASDNPAEIHALTQKLDALRFHYDELALALTTALQVVVTLFAYLILNPRLARHLALRSGHSLPFALLTVLGAAATRYFAPEFSTHTWVGLLPSIFIALTVFHAFNVAIVQNDHFDRHEDRRGPLPYLDLHDMHFFNASMWFLAITAFSVRPRVGAFLLLFQLVSVLYNYDFYRAKRFFPANYKIEAIWGWSAFMAGAYTVIHPRAEVPDAVLAMSFLVFGGWSLFNAFKDYKDIREDYRAGIQTAYVLLKRRGRSLHTFHLWLRRLMTVGFLVPLPFFYLRGASPLLLVAVAAATTGPLWWALGRAPVRSTVEITLGIVSLYIAALIGLFEMALA